MEWGEIGCLTEGQDFRRQTSDVSESHSNREALSGTAEGVPFEACYRRALLVMPRTRASGPTRARASACSDKNRADTKKCTAVQRDASLRSAWQSSKSCCLRDNIGIVDNHWSSATLYLVRRTFERCQKQEPSARPRACNAKTYGAMFVKDFSQGLALGGYVERIK